MTAIVVGTNSYISADDLTTYTTDRGYTLINPAPQLIFASMDYLESLQYKGWKTDREQPLQFPRRCLYIDCVLQDENELPQLLLDAQCEVCIAIDQGNSPISTIERGVQSEKVDVIQVTYMANAGSTSIVRTINTKLKKLLTGYNSGNFVQVHRT